MFIEPKVALKYNIIVLSVISLLSYYFSNSVTALIPFFFAVILAIIFLLYEKNNKLFAHIALLVILLLLFGLWKPLSSAFDRSDSFAIIRVSCMILFNLYTLFCFINSFIQARK